MQYKQSIQTLVQHLRRLPKRYYVILVIIFVGLWYGLTFGPRYSMVFSYGGETCRDRLTVLPQLQRSPGGAAFTISTRGGIDGLFATMVCASPAQVPKQGIRYAALAPFGGWVFRQQFSVEVPEPPVANITPLKKPLSTTRELKLQLSAADQIFEYTMDIAGKTVACATRQQVIGCDIARLKLAQGEQYKVELSRKFGKA